MSKRTGFMVLMPAAALAMLSFAVFHTVRRNSPLPELAPPAAPARTAYNDAIAATGVVEAATQNISVGTALAGVVLEVYVPAEQVGQRVAADTPLFRVDDRHLQAQLAAAQAKVVAAESQLQRLEALPRPETLPPAEAKIRSARANAERLADEYRRAEQLFKRGTTTESDLITKRYLYEAAQQQVAEAEADFALLKAGAWEPDKEVARQAIREAKAEGERIRTEIERAIVRAPVDGEVLQVNVRKGQTVGLGDNSPLVILGNTRELHIRVDVDEHDIPRLRTDTPATAFARGAAAQPVKLAFQRVEPYVIGKRALSGSNTERIDTRVLPVIYTVQAREVPLYVGQQVDVYVETGAPPPKVARK